ncbi:MAG TPA: SCO family protein [Chitinophagaceae bacterium]|nr:SCO family protein [Chitinophagaceae bacterium]
MSRKRLFYTVFFVVLFATFYFILTRLIPGFGKKKVPPISYVHPFRFINQDGKAFTEKEVEGKVFVAEYFFTTCEVVCPKMNRNMRKVYDEFKGDKNFLILSHTSMPETDSVGRLKAFADSMGVNTAQWIFLTGRKDSLYGMARNSYTIDDPKNNLQSIEDQFMHTQFWALVDKHGDVREIYDGMKDVQVKACIKEIARLLRN